jgi:putative FmdB family regulatory protein
MPTYAYACTSCGHRFDAVQSFSEPSLTECPVCGGTVRKQYGSIGVTFNGSGFYRTDSRNTASTSGAGAGAAPAPAPSSGSGAPAAPAATGS